MLQAEMPFGSWRESELESFAKISKGQLTLPQTFSLEVVDLVTKVFFAFPLCSLLFPCDLLHLKLKILSFEQRST